MKKALYFALALAIGTTALTGCGKKDTSDSRKTIVTIWGNGAGVNVEADYAKKFNETIGAEKNIKIDYQVKEGDIAYNF